LPSVLLLGAACFSLVLTQTGCPGGADLENPDQWADHFGAGGTGGTGAGGTPGGPVLDFSTVDCGGLNITDPKTGVLAHCATAGCHKGAALAGVSNLDLTPNDGFAARLKDQPAVHGSLSCPTPDDPFATCTTPPAQCPTDAKLVNSSAPESSWLSAKIHDMANDCGDMMPPPGYKALTADELTCMDNIIKAVAALK
jgi:hypothetical protein